MLMVTDGGTTPNLGATAPPEKLSEPEPGVVVRDPGGDPHATFTWLYTHYESHVRHVAASVLKRSDRLNDSSYWVEDAAQESWARIWRALVADQWDGTHPKQWLGQIVTNRVRDENRRHSQKLTVPEGTPGAHYPKGGDPPWRWAPRPRSRSLEGLRRGGDEARGDVGYTSMRFSPYPWGARSPHCVPVGIAGESEDPQDVVADQEEAHDRWVHLKRLLSRLEPSQAAYWLFLLTSLVNGKPLSRNRRGLAIGQCAHLAGGNLSPSAEKSLRHRARESLLQEARRDPWQPWEPGMAPVDVTALWEEQN